MKELSLYRIRDLAWSSGRSVFSVQQLANLIGKSKAISTVYSSRLVEKGLAVRVLKGVISFENDSHVIATQLVEPSYVSLDSALLFHGIIKQIPRNIECVTPKNSLKYEGLGIVYHKIPSSLFFGYRKHLKGKSYVFVAEPGKAFVDGFYLNLYAKKDLIEYSEKLDFSKVKGLLKAFKGRAAKK
ncbi:MAG: hypothetical protein AB1467_01975 [Candidatus Diapherotrites archaeon]